MGKTWLCCCSTPQTTNNTSPPPETSSQPTVTSHSNQPNDNPGSSSVLSIDSILNSIQEENTTDYIDKLIKMLEDMLSKIKGEEAEVSTSSGVEFEASTRPASQVVDLLSPDAGKISNLEIISEGLGIAATSVLNAIGRSHFVFLGLNLVAYTLEAYLKMKSNDSACKEFVEEFIDLAKDVKKFTDAVPGESEKVSKAIQEIAVEAVKCRFYRDRVSASRYLVAGVMESHLQKTKEVIQRLRASLALAAGIHTADRVGVIERHIPTHSIAGPSEPLAFLSEAIEAGVADVTKLLDIGGSEEAIAVVIVGVGGIGKTTLANSVFNSLNLPSDFKSCKVTINQKASDKRSHIVGLQSDIIFHFTGVVKYLQDPEQGRLKLKEVMARETCFLYIDNVVESNYIKELLPSELISLNRSEEKSAEKPESQMQKSKIRILITSRQNNLKPLLNINIFEHKVEQLSGDIAKKFLSKEILQGKPAHEFEEDKINELAEACGGLPLLLSMFGNHLKDNRDKDSYNEAIKALKEGNIDRYGPGDEELLSERLMFVYDQMKDEEAQEAFLDICTYFHGHPWDLVADILDSATLAILLKKMLVSKSQAGTVIVHDILRLMGEKKAKDTRLMNYNDFFHINDDESKLRSVKGMVLEDRTFLATLETRHLNVMRHSLRFLVLGDWVRVDGHPCDRAFKSLRFLQVGDMKDFPFKDVSKMEKLSVFWNNSKPGMDLAQLPSNLKSLVHKIPYRDCNEFARLPLRNLKSLKQFSVQTKRSVRLPQGFKLPSSLERLELNSCEQLPETVGHLSALQTLSLDKCDLKDLPQGYTQSAQLTSLSMQHCTNLICLQDNIFPSSCSLEDFRLTGCTRLEKLPATLGSLNALQSLDIRDCKKLSLLPENFGGLKCLRTLALDGCISLQKLPDSFGMLRIEYLTLQSLASLKELPQSIGELSCLKSLRLISCHSLEFVPNSFVLLTNLDSLEVTDCIKLGALPPDFDHLRSLENITLSGCPLLTRLPDGFEKLKTVKVMELKECRSLGNLPTCFEMLSCLEVLCLYGLLFSSLPDGLGKLKMLKVLWIGRCHKFQTMPQDFENLHTLEQFGLWRCPMLEGTTMDKIVKLQNCYYVDIDNSTKLIERWTELKEENKDHPMIVMTSRGTLDEDGKERDRARRVGLLCGECIHLDSTTQQLIHHSSLSIPNNTTIAVISLQLDQHQLLQRTVDMAKERAKINCAGQLRIIYVCRRSEEEETEKIRQTLMMLPDGISYFIPSTDLRRLFVIGRAVFNNRNVFNDATGPKLLCFMVDVREDDEGHQIFEDGKSVTEDEISKTSGEKLSLSEDSDEEPEISDGIVELINSITDGKTQSVSEQRSRLAEENMIEEFIQKLKNNNIHHFSDDKVKVDHLQGKTVAIILIDQNYPECKILQQIYHDIKLKHSNFEAIWIPLEQEEDLGFGTYSRAIQRMPWLTLADPTLIKINDIKDKTPCVIIINSGGSIVNPNALSVLMSLGSDAYPFTTASLSQLDLKSSLEILFHSTGIKVPQEVNNKVVFLYAEPPNEELKMKCSLEKLVQIHGESNFEIVYVGRFVPGGNGAESVQKAYEDATASMNWTKLSFVDMIGFWYRCKYSLDEVVEEPNSASTLNRLLKAVWDEKRWLVVVDGDGMVTAHGMDVVEMACESGDDEVDIEVKKELRESLKEEKCREGVRRYFRDEINHPQHHHPLRLPYLKEKDQRFFCCDICDVSYADFHSVYTSYGKRKYRCDDCDWDLCWECWKEFVKEEVRRQQATQES